MSEGEAQAKSGRALAQAALTVGALGVVFGDLGTSPIYTIQTVFNPSDPHPVAVNRESVFGVVSLIFWAVTLIVTVTYVLLVMRADNDGEGGIMALISLLRRGGVPGSARTKAILAALGVFGASLFFGDSMITPAISVLSAVEGLKVVEPSLDQYVIPITAVIIVLLFASQRFGSTVVGRFFGPVMVVWFFVVGACGVAGIAPHPEILKALSPTYAVGFLFGHFSTAFFSLAAVVLAVTGAEALYADLGHFGRAPITRAWLLLVAPACVLSYMGQGALVLGDPSKSNGAFFLLVPHSGRLPLVILATAATVIASQAVISGAFSVAHQAVGLGYLPRLRILHTSGQFAGQIYMPLINWLLMVSVLTLIFAFRSSAGLAFAFGMAVTGTITITTLLYFYIARNKWHEPLWLILPLAALLLTVDLLFFAANLTKIGHGAWLPLLIALAVFTIFTTWQRGRQLITERREREEGSLRHFIDDLHEHRPDFQRTPGTAVYLNRKMSTAPLAMRASVEHNHTLQEHVVILSITTKPVPQVAPEDRVRIDDLGFRDDNISHVSAQYGYMEYPNVPEALRRANAIGLECPLEVETASYFLSTIDLQLSDEPGMARWRKHIFVALSHITHDAAEYFRLPPNRTLIVGSIIEV